MTHQHPLRLPPRSDQALDHARRHRERAPSSEPSGIDVVSFGAGEPDFDTPEHIKDAAIAAIRRGATKYTPVGGTSRCARRSPPSSSATTASLVSPDQVLVSNGAKHSLYNMFMALHRSGRRGDHPGALLGELSGHGDARRRRR